jgi:hypothetical protein
VNDGDLARALDESRKCFRAAGASIATSAEELSFFDRDFAKGETDKPAGATSGAVKVSEHGHVETLESSGRESPPSYLVFVGQGADEADIDPPRAVERDPSEAFVAYLVEPSRREVAQARQCLNRLGDEGRAGPRGSGG